MAFRIIPLPEEVAAEARATHRAPGYGHPIHRDIAQGYGPCRKCLRTLNVGVEGRLLLTYDAFMDIERLPLPGPIYIHEDDCGGYEMENAYPEVLRFIPTTLNAYARGRQLREVRYVEPDGDAERAINDLLSRPDVDYIHARNTEAGCYMFRIERA
jgi:hypothetical protein